MVATEDKKKGQQQQQQRVKMRLGQSMGRVPAMVVNLQQASKQQSSAATSSH